MFFKKYFSIIFLIKSWEVIESFSFIAITKKTLCLIEVGGEPKSPPAWNRVKKAIKVPHSGGAYSGQKGLTLRLSSHFFSKNL